MRRGELSQGVESRVSVRADDRVTRQPNPRRARATGCALSGALCTREGNGTGHTQHTARGPRTTVQRPRRGRVPHGDRTPVRASAPAAPPRRCRYIVQSSSPIVFAYSWCVYTCNRSLPQPVHLAGTYAHTKRHNSHVHHRDPYVGTIRTTSHRRTHRANGHGVHVRPHMFTSPHMRPRTRPSPTVHTAPHRMLIITGTKR